MKRLKKVAYSQAQFLLDTALSSGKEMLTIYADTIEKRGETTSQDEVINVDIKYYIKKEDLEYITNREITDEQWEDFYNYIRKINIPDFEDLKVKLGYDAMDDITRKLPNEDLNTYELEYFNFNYVKQDYSDIDLKLEARFTKIY
jgi:hypothetical protein